MTSARNPAHLPQNYKIPDKCGVIQFLHEVSIEASLSHKCVQGLNSGKQRKAAALPGYVNKSEMHDYK